MRRLGIAAAGTLLLGLTAAAPEQPPADQEQIYQGEATSILGRAIHDLADNQVGRIADVLVDDQGQPRAAVIDFGGFMGVGNRKIAVAWRALHFQPADKHFQIRIDLSLDQIKDTPEYKPPPRPLAAPVTIAAPPPPPGLPALEK